ncbi:hypothetical protein ACIF83_33865 [Streptomyces sp. NPDC085866]|uniref:hypothetical protein n=1 Tax=unclassified Streptomyces TaxID=2593676 RepID=UPI00379B0C54
MSVSRTAARLIATCVASGALVGAAAMPALAAGVGHDRDNGRVYSDSHRGDHDGHFGDRGWDRDRGWGHDRDRDRGWHHGWDRDRGWHHGWDRDRGWGHDRDRDRGWHHGWDRDYDRPLGHR